MGIAPPDFNDLSLLVSESCLSLVLNSSHTVSPSFVYIQRSNPPRFLPFATTVRTRHNNPPKNRNHSFLNLHPTAQHPPLILWVRTINVSRQHVGREAESPADHRRQLGGRVLQVVLSLLSSQQEFVEREACQVFFDGVG